jgi:hypothetical protein
MTRNAELILRVIPTSDYQWFVHWPSLERAGQNVHRLRQYETREEKNAVIRAELNRRVKKWRKKQARVQLTENLA